MDFEQIVDKEKEALHIAHVNESELDFIAFRNTFGEKKLEIFKHDDDSLEISLGDETFILDKNQIDFLFKWFTHSC